ncbi:hypothetical protein JOF29_005551 [Kribbella aluminosa]|uniref:DivIVA domain-containing protein n=1 Tax=Kribbella aluminosa TaxID=416017 RepID=A0ABS4US17_9ACTN|nr:hypothetical protein [Kribbella aluminosa]MBP2354441.1 hypothetical protein [Kribbella aluminosa]
MTADNAEHSGRSRGAVSVDELFRGTAPVRSADDLAADGVFDDGEVDEFLADLGTMRRADVA